MAMSMTRQELMNKTFPFTHNRTAGFIFWLLSLWYIIVIIIDFVGATEYARFFITLSCPLSLIVFLCIPHVGGTTFLGNRYVIRPFFFVLHLLILIGIYTIRFELWKQIVLTVVIIAGLAATMVSIAISARKRRMLEESVVKTPAGGAHHGAAAPSVSNVELGFNDKGVSTPVHDDSPWGKV